jgi:formate-dependent nitrite reductase membrane component NrfD
VNRGAGGAGGHRDDRPDQAELRVARAKQEAQVADEGRRAGEARRGERDTTPALGEPGGPAAWRRAFEGATVGLHRRAWGDGRWSYLFGADTDYATAEPPPPGTVEAAARRARTGPPPDRVQGPVMKAPVWTWEVPTYFWFGGIASGASFVALACDLAGDHRSARTARLVALGALAPSPPLLVMDLGRPERFLNMLRVFKPRSPMSMGAWALTAFGNLAAGAVGADLLGRERTARALGGATALVGGYLGSYTGVLLASTAVPVWARSRLFLGPIFVATATATGAAATRLVLVATGLPVGHPTREALGRVETGAMTAELLLSTVNEHRLGRLAHALEEGTPGRFLRAAKWLVRGGLALRLARRRGGPAAHHVASVAYLAAGLCFRFAWVTAGPPSARDDEAVVRMARAHATADEPEAVVRVVHTG